jgi:LAO/AO transport system kinase
LGDRVRMRDLFGDPGIFIRSMASRGSLGGLARATTNVVKVLDAAGFDVILIETVGAGQAEVEIAGAAHTVLVIEAPGMGDEIQSIKAGILETADILVVNKADRSGSDRTVKALKMMLHLAPADYDGRGHHAPTATAITTPAAAPAPAKWQVPVLKAVATEGTGIDEIVTAVAAHKAYLHQSGEWLAREKDRSRQEIDRLLQAHFMAELRTAVSSSHLEELITNVADRTVDPYTAVSTLFNKVKEISSV